MSGEIITLGQLTTPPETRLISDEEQRQLDEEAQRHLRNEAIAGRLRWYEIEWRNLTEGTSGLYAFFRTADDEISETDLNAIIRDQNLTRGTDYAVYCYTGANAQAHVAEMERCDSLLFDNAETVIVVFEFPINALSYRLDSFVGAGEVQ